MGDRNAAERADMVQWEGHGLWDPSENQDNQRITCATLLWTWPTGYDLSSLRLSQMTTTETITPTSQPYVKTVPGNIFENCEVLNTYSLLPDATAFSKESFFEIKLTYCPFHPFEVYNSMVFSTFTELLINTVLEYLYHLRNHVPFSSPFPTP